MLEVIQFAMGVVQDIPDGFRHQLSLDMGLVNHSKGVDHFSTGESINDNCEDGHSARIEHC